VTVEALPNGEAEGLTRKAVQMALDGDMTALRLCLERISPPRKDAPITVALPKVETARDAAAAAGAVVEALASGELTPAKATPVMALVDAFRRTLETAELEARVAAFEFGAAGRPNSGAE
jgi:hypothetical protein